MTNERAAHILRKFNDYRRTDHEPCDPPFTAQAIGQAIDIAADMLEASIVKADIGSIIKAVTRETGVTHDEMCRRGRQRERVEARAVVAWLTRHYTAMSLTSIGERIGRAHTTTMHYIDAVGSWLADPRRNPRAAYITNKLINELENHEE